jgi:hypothetical protein
VERQAEAPVDKVLADLPGLPKGLQLEPPDCSSFLTQQHDDSSSTSTYLDLLLQQCQGLEVADHVLINFFYELQTEVRSFVPVMVYGPPFSLSTESTSLSTVFFSHNKLISER